MTTSTNRQEALEKSLKKLGSSLNPIPGGLPEGQQPHIEHKQCVCDLETRKACAIDRIKPRKPGCVMSNETNQS